MRRLSPLALVSLVAVGCSSEGGSDATPPPEAGSFDDRTASVLVGDGTTAFTLDSCEITDDSFHLTGRSESGATLEALGDVGGNGRAVPIESTGLVMTAIEDLQPIGHSAFGEDAWTDRGGSGEPPGAVGNARVNGPLIQMAGEVGVVDEDEQLSGGEPQTFSLDAYCDEQG